MKQQFAVKADDETGDLLIAIPDETLNLLGWKEGDVVNYTFEDGCIVLTKAARESVAHD